MKKNMNTRVRPNVESLESRFAPAGYNLPDLDYGPAAQVSSNASEHIEIVKDSSVQAGWAKDGSSWQAAMVVTTTNLNGWSSTSISAKDGEGGAYSGYDVSIRDVSFGYVEVGADGSFESHDSRFVTTSSWGYDGAWYEGSDGSYSSVGYSGNSVEKLSSYTDVYASANGALTVYDDSYYTLTGNGYGWTYDVGADGSVTDIFTTESVKLSDTSYHTEYWNKDGSGSVHDTEYLTISSRTSEDGYSEAADGGWSSWYYSGASTESLNSYTDVYLWSDGDVAVFNDSFYTLSSSGHGWQTDVSAGGNFSDVFHTESFRVSDTQYHTTFLNADGSGSTHDTQYLTVKSSSSQDGYYSDSDGGWGSWYVSTSNRENTTSYLDVYFKSDGSVTVYDDSFTTLVHSVYGWSTDISPDGDYVDVYGSEYGYLSGSVFVTETWKPDGSGKVVTDASLYYYGDTFEDGYASGPSGSGGWYIGGTATVSQNSHSVLTIKPDGSGAVSETSKSKVTADLDSDSWGNLALAKKGRKTWALGNLNFELAPSFLPDDLFEDVLA